MAKKFDAQDRHFLGDWGVVEINALVDTRKALAGALTAAFSEHRGATHYKVYANPETGANSLDLRWCDTNGGIPLPFPIEASQAVEFVASWLAANGQWPNQRPDTDGDCHQGFRVESGAFSGEFGDFYTSALITPEWTIYGK
jgi:hypothetical protein